jgi:Fe-S cluster assembly scaffold protein SufB
MNRRSSLPYYLGPIADAPADAQAWYASSVAPDGSGDVLWIPDSVQVEEVISVKPGGGVTSLWVRAGAGSTVMIFEEMMGRMRECTRTVHIVAEPESSVTFVSLQALQAQSATLRYTSALREGANVRWQLATMGGEQVEHSLRSNVDGANAQSSVDWLFAARVQQQFSLSARNVFAAREGGGEITVKGVARDMAHVACKGLIDIGERGTGTQTYLTQQVLMLDASAKIDAVPGLEIKTNDVKASHSATVSRLSPEDLFYVVARGIGAEVAKAMLVEGFLRELTERIADTEVREHVWQAVMEASA